jgi:Holliday junction resolvase RusA-like endonuclease
MTAPLTLVFAMPPSVNHVWQHGKHGSYKAPAYKRWIAEAGWQIATQAPRSFSGDVAVEMRVGPRDKRRDLDNFAKGPLDDRNVVDLRISWAPDVTGCEITITSRET